MADPTPKSAAAMAFWGEISAAATQRMSAAQLQTKISAASKRLGVATTFGVRQEIARLFSQAVALRTASEALGQASPSDAITHAMLAPLPYGGGLIGGNAPRTFDVRVPYTAVRTGQEESDYVTLRYTGGLPATVGDLLEDAQLITEGLVEGYGAALVSVGTPQIGEL